MASGLAGKRNLIPILAGGLALRVILSHTPLAQVLERRPELSSPITSFRSCKCRAEASLTKCTRQSLSLHAEGMYTPEVYLRM
jgi:hypothetical protein